MAPVAGHDHAAPTRKNHWDDHHPRVRGDRGGVPSNRASGLGALCACEGRDVTASEARSYNRDQPHGSRMQNRLAAQYAVDTRAVHRLLREASIEQVEWLSPNELGQQILAYEKKFLRGREPSGELCPPWRAVRLLSLRLLRRRSAHPRIPVTDERRFGSCIA